MIPPVVVHCGFGGLLILSSLPLITRVVPMNHIYGIRTRKAFASEANWYAINAYGGRLFALYGVALVAFGWLARDSAPPPTSVWSPVFTVGPLVLVLPVLLLINAYGKRLPD